MDTDDLTEMAYEIIVLAGQASDFLKAEIGALSHRFSREDDFLKGVLAFVRRVKEDPEGYLDEWNILDTTNLPLFEKAVGRLEKQIVTVLSTPMKMRGDPPDYSV